MKVTEQIPHFDVTTLDGRRVRYPDIWQRRMLVLVELPRPSAEPARAYAAALQARAGELAVSETALVVTADAVLDGSGQSTVAVADRWGEIVHLESVPAGSEASLSSFDALAEWVHFTRMQCPECPAGLQGW